MIFFGGKRKWAEQLSLLREQRRDDVEWRRCPPGYLLIHEGVSKARRTKHGVPVTAASCYYKTPT